MSSGTAAITAFRRTRLRPGYRPEEVKAFVESVEDALRSPTPRMTGSDVAWQRFTPVLLRSGYHKDDVDHYLTEAEHLLYERERLPSHAPDAIVRA
jgi:DivIVA domain-containing protein